MNANRAGGCFGRVGGRSRVRRDRASSDGDEHDPIVYANLERLCCAVAAPGIVKRTGPHAKDADADFYKAKISDPNSRKVDGGEVDRSPSILRGARHRTPPGHVLPPQPRPRTSPDGPGRKSAFDPLEEAEPRRPTPLPRQPADVSRLRPESGRLGPRAEARRPRGPDPRLRRRGGPKTLQVDHDRRDPRPPRQDDPQAAVLHRRPRRGRRPAVLGRFASRSPRPPVRVPLERPPRPRGGGSGVGSDAIGECSSATAPRRTSGKDSITLRRSRIV